MTAVIFFLIIVIALVLVGLFNYLLILPISFFIICIGIMIYAKKRLKTWLNLISLISLIYILGYIVRFITLIYGYNHFSIPESNMLISLIYSFIVYLLFIFGFVLGFSLKTSSHLIIKKPNNLETRIIITINLLITIGNTILLFALFGGWSGLTGSFSEKTQEFSGMGPFFVFLSSLAISLILLIAIGSLKINFLTFSLVILSLFPLVTTGGRILLFLVAMSYILAYEFKYNILKLRNILIFSALGLLFYIGYFSYFRVYNLTGSWDYLLENAEDLYYNTLVNGALSFIDGLNVIMFYVPESVNYLGGYSLIAGLLIFIPSALIPYKPDNTAMLYNEIFNQSQYQSGTGQNPSFLGELYWNIGPINTLLVFLTIGIIIGIIYKKAISTSFNSQYFSVIFLIFLIPIALFTIKSGISSGTPYRILVPLLFNLTLFFLMNKVKWRKKL